MITTSRRLALSGERFRRKVMSARRSPRRETGAVVSILLIVLPSIMVPLALVLIPLRQAIAKAQRRVCQSILADTALVESLLQERQRKATPE